VNKIIVSGNLVRDAELRFTPQGTPVAEFRLGVRDDMLKKRENRSVFLDVVLFGQRAELLHKYLLKGKSIMVEGRLDVRINKAQDGRTFTNVQIYANQLEFLGKKGESPDSSPENSSQQETAHEETDFEIPEEENTH
jgi:single-strand DNA-binding protein